MVYCATKKFAVEILLVEDDLDDVDFFRATFEDEPDRFIITTLSDGEKAITYFRFTYTLPDIIVLDLNLPRIDGREVLKMLRTDSRLAAIPVLIYTTSRSERDKEYCDRYSVEKYITKASTFQGLKSISEAIHELTDN